MDLNIGDRMERGPIVSEYYQLRDYLNRANKLSNKKTTMTFKIEEFSLLEYRLYVTSNGVNETHKLALSERNRSKNWERAGFTRFRKLEEYCTYFLNKEESKQVVPFKSLKISDNKLQELEKKINTAFSNLLLKKNYQP